MTTLSIILPDDLAKASREAARELGVSRTQFIRLAIAHEIESLQSQLEQRAITKSFMAMKGCKSYLEESKEITEGLNSNLDKEEDEWWSKERY